MICEGIAKWNILHLIEEPVLCRVWDLELGIRLTAGAWCSAASSLDSVDTGQALGSGRAVGGEVQPSDSTETVCAFVSISGCRNRADLLC